MQVHLSFDMRTPTFGADKNDLYRTMLDICQWADDRDIDMVNFGEHHASPDGYTPSPLTLAAAVAGCTKNIGIRTSVLLATLYDPIKLAEDAATVALLSGGRFALGIGAGYRQVEFDMFDKDLSQRWQAMPEIISVLRQAWSGEPFVYKGKTVQVTPTPEPAPAIILGGSSPAAARRAAHIADGWLPPLDPRLWDPYRDECIRIGREDPGPWTPYGPTFLWISANPEASWNRYTPHIVSQIEEYRAFTTEAFGKAAGPWRGATSAAEVRNNPAYQILSPTDVLKLAEQLGDNGIIFLNPLMSGIEPADAWQMLELFEREVMPQLT